MNNTSKAQFGGSSAMTTFLRRQGWKINRKRVQRLMRTMGLEAVYPRPKTSKSHPEIFNTDQGSQFTNNKFTGKFEEHDIKVSMDGRGRY